MPINFCTTCGQPVRPGAVRCASCGAGLPGASGDLSFRQPEPGVGAVDFLVPMKVSIWSLLSCYLGLIGFCLPLFGLVFAIPGLIFGIIALIRRNKSGTYGAVTSDLRAIIGVILGGLGTLIWGLFWLYVLYSGSPVLKQFLALLVLG